MQKKAYFSTGIIRSLAENRFWKGIKIVFYEEQNTGYFSIDLSQFHNFWRTLTVLRGGGGALKAQKIDFFSMMNLCEFFF